MNDKAKNWLMLCSIGLLTIVFSGSGNISGVFAGLLITVFSGVIAFKHLKNK